MTDPTTSPALLPVILSGGSGTRLWPLSRESYPKQLLPLVGGHSMLQASVQRLDGLGTPGGTLPPLVICNESHRFIVASQLQEIGVEPGALVLEPVGRNTAPAVAVAALHASAAGEDPLLLVLPADHVILDVEGFRDAVRRAIPAAEAGYLVTFGVTPDAPETGYGYIQMGDRLPAGPGEAGAHAVVRFVEKPDADTAREYLADGGYAWNSGMFLLRAGRYLEELGSFRPDMLAACRRAVDAARKDLDFLRLDEAAFSASPSESMDYAVMEHTARAAVVPVSIGWSDVGSWAALWEVAEHDEDGNHLRGDVFAHDTRGSYLHAEHRLLTTVGVDDLMVVETRDAVLVAHKDRSQEIRAIVDRLRAAERTEADLHRKVYRPWGAYDAIDAGPGFQVKRITVNPGGRLSLQKHAHRAEHWVVVRGTARVTCDDRVFLLEENESTYIPLGSTHRLENPGTEPVELIEVQSGSYLGEDDIVRFEDVYGRGGGDREDAE
ncbi:mannose-1-phosphate guanylyltransferase/mannose-6-phosphate isomerase [soil metagenome]